MITAPAGRVNCGGRPGCLHAQRPRGYGAGHERPHPTSPGGVTTNRWLLVVAALLLQFAIGAVYAWSVFAKALQEADAFHLSTLQSTLPFEVTIGMIFIGSYLGGRIQDRRGPRTVAMVGGSDGVHRHRHHRPRLDGAHLHHQGAPHRVAARETEAAR